MNKERLIKLAEHLETKVPANRFDMGRWGMLALGATSLVECDSAACALGWATTVPEFRKEGLKLASGMVFLGNLTGYEAASALFGITESQASALFHGLNREHEEPKDVAERIRTFVETGHA